MSIIPNTAAPTRVLWSSSGTLPPPGDLLPNPGTAPPNLSRPLPPGFPPGFF